MEFIELPSICKDNLVSSSIPNYFNNSETPNMKAPLRKEGGGYIGFGLSVIPSSRPSIPSLIIFLGWDCYTSFFIATI